METGIIAGVLLLWFLAWAIVHGGTKPITAKQYDDELATDFKKYGPLPDDIDDIKLSDYLTNKEKCSVCFQKRFFSYGKRCGFTSKLVCGECGTEYIRETEDSNFKLK